MTTSAPEKPKNVIEAIAVVMAGLPGIGKDDKASKEQGGYSYRGIESITRHAQQLFGKYGVVFVLREEEAHIVDIIVNSKPWTDNFLTVHYDVFGPGGVDDKITIGPIHVQGRDNSDKGYNKARTQAFKYALLQVLCIGDGKDDADGTNQEADSRNAQAPPAEPPSAQVLLATRIKNLPEEQREKVKKFVEGNELPSLPNEWTDEHLEMIGRKVDALEKSTENASTSEGTPPPPTSDAEAGGNPSEAGGPPASPSAKPEWDRDSLLKGIAAYEERLDETTFPIYTAWLTDLFGGESADITKFDGPDLEQVWRKLEELTTEGAPAQ